MLERGQSVSRAVEKLDVSVDDLKQQVRSIAAKLNDLADASQATQTGFSLTQFSVALGIQAGGQVGLLGTGVDLRGTATLTLTFSHA